MTTKFLSIHGHFYQPLRRDPFTGRIGHEPWAEPYHDFNEKINAECYRPNAEAGNFRHMSFNLGPTLACWLEEKDPRTYETILAADREHNLRYGCGSALAQAYNHAILPLASSREKRIQIAWGIADYQHRLGHAPEGFWLAETAVDYASLNIMAAMGIRFTILAPWQAATPVDPSEPYLVSLSGGRSITVFFFDASLSEAVSFNDEATVNADVFSARLLAKQLNPQKLSRGEPQMLLVATDGETYGHHKCWRDKFLTHLFNVSAPRDGFEVITLARYLHLHPPAREALVEEDSSWSCHHGLKRWRDSCDCIVGSGSWKWHLRHALTRLAAKVDAIYELQAGPNLRDPWSTVEDYVEVKLGRVSPRAFLSAHSSGAPVEACQALLRLLEAQYYRHVMFTSCAFFFEDLDRIEPRNNIAFAARAIALIRSASGIDLEEAFVSDLSAARSWKTNRSGADIYREVKSQRRKRREEAGAATGSLTAA
ncbi:MAG: DUF3536 domain-containing protein [Chloroflexi bacterium]|nr:DUF3536 domain-containing protein [Chloroflexota bacterium]